MPSFPTSERREKSEQMDGSGEEQLSFWIKEEVHGRSYPRIWPVLSAAMLGLLWPTDYHHFTILISFNQEPWGTQTFCTSRGGWEPLATQL